MALDFPNSPSTGQQFPGPNGITYTFDGVKWTVFAGSGGGGGSGSFVGPVTIGQPALPTPAPAVLVADQTVLRISPGGLPQLGFNQYLDGTGTVCYADNGPGADIDVHATAAGGAPVPRLAINLSANNTAGPGAATTNRAGVFNLIASLDGAGTIAPWAFMGVAGDVAPLLSAGSPSINTLVASQLAIRPGITPPNGSYSRLAFNEYVANDGSWRYLDNGPGASINMHNIGFTGNPMSRMAIGLADINNAGPGASAANEGNINIVYGAPGSVAGAGSFVVIGGADIIPTTFPIKNTLIADYLAVRSTVTPRPDNIATILFNVVGAADGTGFKFMGGGPGGMIQCHDVGTGVSRISINPWDFNNSGPGAPVQGGAGGLNVVSGAPGSAMPYVTTGVVTDDVHGPFYPEWGSILCHGTLTAGSDPLPGSPDRVARIGLNMFQQGFPAGGAWVYYKDGPAANMTTHDANQGVVPLPYENLRFSVLSAAAANTQTASPPCFVIMTQTAATLNSTNIMLYANPSGTPTLKSVFVGAPGTGPNGGCALYVAP